MQNSHEHVTTETSTDHRHFIHSSSPPILVIMCSVRALCLDRSAHTIALSCDGLVCLPIGLNEPIILWPHSLTEVFSPKDLQLTAWFYVDCIIQRQCRQLRKNPNGAAVLDAATTMSGNNHIMFKVTLALCNICQTVTSLCDLSACFTLFFPVVFESWVVAIKVKKKKSSISYPKILAPF